MAPSPGAVLPTMVLVRRRSRTYLRPSAGDRPCARWQQPGVGRGERGGQVRVAVLQRPHQGGLQPVDGARVERRRPGPAHDGLLERRDETSVPTGRTPVKTLV